MPRSASTLQSNIAKCILESSGLGKREEWSINWQKDLPNVLRMIEDEKVFLFKTHSVTDEILGLASSYPDKVSFLVSYRDVRDVAASMMIKFDYSFDKAVERIGQSIRNIEKLRLSDCRVLEQRYQELRHGLEGAVGNVNAFLSAGLEEETLKTIAFDLNIEKAYSKSRVKRIPFEGLRRRFAFLFKTKFPYADSEMMLHVNHVSEHKGRTGFWEDYLTAVEASSLSQKFSGWVYEI
jgi:hypothetical protein